MTSRTSQYIANLKMDMNRNMNIRGKNIWLLSYPLLNVPVDLNNHMTAIISVFGQNGRYSTFSYSSRIFSFLRLNIRYFPDILLLRKFSKLLEKNRSMSLIILLPVMLAVPNSSINPTKSSTSPLSVLIRHT